MINYQVVTETVTRNGYVRMIDDLLADGIVAGAERSGFTVTRTWTRGIFTATVTRPNGVDPMLTYTLDTRN